ncbi:hypothetical protein BTZ20_3722 [Rhodococcus sp. MTM3W5.2]|uniref:DUF302 domain-containing protein n=1 Tax=Rhodococcus sp. MTM3W5.2 TaxID=1805827 RepID=UPI0009792888|nr:DUF302 domain-containing protein [Rhodococcus sp. MTM3W5.2]AQA20637.1 hypothetical protein BTZ20_3722 [Rhodococcus sp. MTM3W5.2]
MNLALSTTLRTSFADAVERTRKALQEQGFGVLTEIDMRATLKTKLDVDMEDYLILGACNPPLAHRAVTIDRQIGLLLPCNVIVRSDPDTAGTITVEAMNPELMVQVTGEPALEAVAEEAGARLRAAIASVGDAS